MRTCSLACAHSSSKRVRVTATGASAFGWRLRVRTGCVCIGMGCASASASAQPVHMRSVRAHIFRTGPQRIERPSAFSQPGRLHRPSLHVRTSCVYASLAVGREVACMLCTCASAWGAAVFFAGAGASASCAPASLLGCACASCWGSYAYRHVVHGRLSVWGGASRP